MENQGGDLWRAQGEAPAKINLALQVLPLQPSGFHGIRTVMLCLDLADSVALAAEWNRQSASPETTRVQLELDTDDAQVPSNQDNLVVKAAHLLLARRVQQLAQTAAARPSLAEFTAADSPANALPGVAYSPPHRLTIHLKKCIPTEAGLGGGSADAAATLRLLNKLPGVGLGSETLFDLAAHLGSDVPFALLGGAALAEGRGEKLTPLPPPPPLWVVLVLPKDVRVATAWCYRRWDELGKVEDRSESLDKLVRAMARSDLDGIAENLFNDLQEPVLREYPHLGAIPQALRLAGCVAAQMTGSGSCFYGLAPTRERAEAAAAAVRRSDLGKVWVTRTHPRE